MHPRTLGKAAVFVAMFAAAGYYASSEGGKEGRLMAECVADGHRSLTEYVTDKDLAERIAIDSCSKHNPDGVVKAPRSGQ